MTPDDSGHRRAADVSPSQWLEGVSVVIPVRGRVRELRRLLESVRQAAAECPEPSEVIVVDDSLPDEARQHRENCAEFGARYLPGPRHVGTKRNLGTRAAAYDLLLFVDSDCRATAGLLRRHVESLRAAEPDIAAVAGPTEVDAGGTAFSRIMTHSIRLNSAFQIPELYAEAGWATTSNLAVRRAAFDAVGGFAETGLTVVAGEDVDLCTRLVQSGRRIRCVLDAVVRHDAGNSVEPTAVVKRLYTYGRSGQWLSVRHPQRRRPKLNPAVTVAAAAAVGACTAPRGGRGRGASLLATAVAGGLLAAQVRTRRRPGDSIAATAQTAAAVLVDWCFDVGEAVAAMQLGRPGLMLTEFGWFADPAFKRRDTGRTGPGDQRAMLARRA